MNQVMLRRLGRAILLLLSLFLFILAIQFMKAGASDLAPFVQNELDVDNLWDALGMGWLAAYFVLSGSPIAAASLTLFDAGALDQVQTFFMITGSRLGASFIVLLIGFVYLLRGHGRRASLAMGLLSLTVTGTTYVLGLGIGYVLLTLRLLDFMKLSSVATVTSVVDTIWGPFVAAVSLYFPGFIVFLVGILVIIISFNLFDRGLPRFQLRRTGFEETAHLLYRPLPMLLLGFLVTLFFLSVSISLSLLVPLSARGFVRRENLIPYIMGANISTFVDTLLASVLLNNPQAVTVVIVEMASIALVSLAIITLFFHAFERTLLELVEAIGRSNRNLAIFLAIIFLIPVGLLLI